MLSEVILRMIMLNGVILCIIMLMVVAPTSEMAKLNESFKYVMNLMLSVF